MASTDELFEQVRTSRRFKALTGDHLVGAESYLSAFKEVVEANPGANNNHLLWAAIEYFLIGGCPPPKNIKNVDAFHNGGNAAHDVMIGLINIVWPSTR